MKEKNTCVVDLNKVSYAYYYWTTKDGYTSRLSPLWPTVHGIDIGHGDNAARYHHDYPHETCLERARRLDILDVWYPKVVLTIYSNKTMTFTGKRATAIWEKLLY